MTFRTVALIIVLGWAGGAAAQTTPVTAPGTTNIEAAPAQTGDPAQNPPAAAGEATTKPTRGFFSSLGHNLGDDLKHIPRRNTAFWLAGGMAAALAVHPIDHSFNEHLTSGPFTGASIVGSLPVILSAGIAAYTFGRAENYPRTEHLGMDEIEGVILSEGIVEGAKEIIRRPRPTQPNGILRSDFSMPSGHATMTFAAATILQQHLGYKAAIPTYLVATWVAMSRLHDNVHYASDVVMGAATGIIIGRSVTWHGRNFYGELQPAPGGGVAIAFATR